MNLRTLSIMLILLLSLTTCNALTITKLGASDVTKREVNPHDLFPDWVPFKNKQGDDLGVFTSLQRKKPKKRLAQPSSFVMRVADGEDDDYFAKGLDDSEEVYESKDWSDLQRTAVDNASRIVIDLNHADLSDIEGIIPTVAPTVASNQDQVRRPLHSSGRRDRERQHSRQNKQKYETTTLPTAERINFSELQLTASDAKDNRANRGIVEGNLSEIVHAGDSSQPPRRTSKNREIFRPDDFVIMTTTEATEAVIPQEAPEEEQEQESKIKQESNVESFPQGPTDSDDKIIDADKEAHKDSTVPVHVGPITLHNHKSTNPVNKEQKTQEVTREPEEEKQITVEDYDSHVPIRYKHDDKIIKSVKRDENSKEFDPDKVVDEENNHDHTNKGWKEKREDVKETEQSDLQIKTDNEEYDESVQNQKRRSIAAENKAQNEIVTAKPQNVKSEDEEEYDETIVEKKEASSKEQRENEEKRRLILSAVDLLKQRHAKEQRMLSERLREEELERDSSPIIDHFNKYSLNSHKLTDLDDYEQQDNYSVKDKYKLKPLVKVRTTTSSTTEKPVPRITKKRINITDSEKMSIFKNPRPYMTTDDEDIRELQVSESKNQNPNQTSSEVFTVSSDSYEEPDPENMIPTYVQNKRVSKKMRKKGKFLQTTTIKPTKPLDVYEDATANSESNSFSYPNNIKNTKHNEGNKTESTNELPNVYVIPTGSTELDTTLPMRANITSLFDVLRDSEETTGREGNTSGEENKGSEGNTESDEPTAKETINGGESEEWSELTKAVKTKSNDTLTAGSKKAIHIARSPEHEHEEKPKNMHFEKGGEKEHYAQHGSTHEEHGKKAYEGIHKDTKSKKGHHDKESHEGDYHDKGGHDLHHHDEKEHYGAHQHVEHGKKHAEYEESGKHSKGHSTKGSHDIHKKEEYEKKVEFFEEDGDSDEEEYSGGHLHKRNHASGGHHKKGNLAAFNDHRDGGEKGFFAKEGFEGGDKGHKAAAGHDSHGKHGSAHNSQGGKQSGKKWIFHHGYPARTANLVIIDRKDDDYSHDLFFG